MKGIIRKRIEKLERQIPQKSKRKQELSFSLHGAHPSKKEEAIAFRNLKKVRSEKHLCLCYVPFDCENTFRIFNHKIISKDANLGILYGEHMMFKLVKQYYTNSCYHDKNCPVITGEKKSLLGEKVYPSNA